MDVLNLGPGTAAVRLLLAHGAGAAMTSPFLEEMCQLLAQRGVATTRFEFAYMAARRVGGPRRPPPRVAALVPEFIAALDAVRATMRDSQRLWIGGKSMGGRVASLIADSEFKAGRVSGLVCLGYPFHPPKKPHVLRTDHLRTFVCPTLIIQGERDPFGARREIESLSLAGSIEFAWMRDGDHDFKPRVRSGETFSGNLAAAADTVAYFVGLTGTDTNTP